MSSFIYGYIYPVPSNKKLARLMDYIASLGIGIIEITSAELFNFPEQCLPTGQAWAFLISSKPNSSDATTLLDYYEYDPLYGMHLGFPCQPLTRLQLVLNALNALLAMTNAERMYVSLNDSCQIGAIKTINRLVLQDTIRTDIEEAEGPPNILYYIQ